MSERVVFNENVLILAYKKEDESGNIDDTCARVLYNVIQSSYQIVVDASIWSKYYHQLHQLSKDTYGVPHILHILDNLRFDSSRFIFIYEEIPSLDEEIHLSAKIMDDIDFIRLAVYSKAILVTTDNPLKEELEGANIIEKYGFSVLKPEEMLAIIALER